MKPKDRRRLKKHIDMVMNSMDDINGIPENYRGHKDMANDELKPRPFCGGGEGMTQGNEKVDELMRPVLDAIRRHVKDRDAITDIYNRAYEAVINSMDELNRCLQFANTTAMEMKHRAEAAEKRITALAEQLLTILNNYSE